ncbi:TonB-dependent receptor [Breoghania sp.]|uniref:TonB-dependent receptor n=1 Tax=Breoghania sp. TaxID=2065378 RepID=UPI002AA66105|nr:TonB-dependent receptor [Breoghania sp.]
MNYGRGLLVAGAALCALPASAQDIDDDTVLLDTVVVTATRNASSLAAVAQSVEVIDGQEIENLRTTTKDAADLISRLIPGYAPSNQTLSGASESFRGRSVLIMVDGVPRNLPLRNNSRILSLIDLDNIERIEVVNGASSLYGAGATGGTINFITRRGESDTPTWNIRTDVKAFTANPGESIAPSLNVNVGGRKEDFDYYFSASGAFADKFFDGKGNEMASDSMLGQGGSDRTRQGNLFGTMGYETGPRRFELSVDWNYTEQHPKWLTDYTTSPISPDFSSVYPGKPLKEDSRYYSAKFTDSSFALGDLEIKAFYNDVVKQSPFSELSSVNSIVYYSGDPANPTSPYNQTVLEGDRFGLNLTVNSPLDYIHPGTTFTWGLDYTFDQTTQALVSGEDVIAPMTQNQISAFGQLEVEVTERLRLQGGARFDQFYLKIDDFLRPDAVQFPGTLYPAVSVLGGSFDYNALTFNAGAVFDVTNEMQAFGNFSQGFSLTDIGAFTRRAGVNSFAEACDAYGGLFPGCPAVAPDFTVSYSDIAPEPQIVNSFETGLRGNWGRFSGKISGFYSTSEEGVNYDVSANRISQQKEEIWGAELSARFEATDRVTLGTNLGYTEGRYDADGDGKIESGEYLPNNRIPTTFKGSVYTDLSFDHGIMARAEVAFFSGRTRIVDEHIDGAALLNLALAKDFDNGGKLAVGVENVLDTAYLNPTATATRGADVPGLGRTVSLSFSRKF